MCRLCNNYRYGKVIYYTNESVIKSFIHSNQIDRWLDGICVKNIGVFSLHLIQITNVMMHSLKT